MMKLKNYTFFILLVTSQLSWSFPWFKKKMPNRDYQTRGVGGICDRHEDIQKQMMVSLDNFNCSSFTTEDVANVSGIWIIYEHGNFKKDLTPIKELTYNDLKGLTGLEELVIQFSEIPSPDTGVFKDLKSIKVIDLSHNQITTVPENLFSGLTTLEAIELDTNPYQDKFLPEKLFYGLINLKILDLDEMNLETLHVNTFATNHKLELIDLESNKITTLPYGVFAPLRKGVIDEVDLTKNPLDPSIRRVIAQLPSGVVSLSKGSQLRHYLF